MRDHVIVFPDTNSLLHYPPMREVNWQAVVDGLNKLSITVGVCGTRETSYDLTGISCRSYDHIDVDSDVEMMNNAKLVVTQETGLQYLSFLCKRPTFCIGNYQGGELHRDTNIFFKNIIADPMLIVQEILNFLKEQK